jgi:hypothetical protein
MVTQRQHQAHIKVYIRAVIAIALIVMWSLAALTGFLLYLAPSGPHSGWMVVFFLTKGQWKDSHFWISVAATLITMLHIAVDWRALKGCTRYLTSIDRSSGICRKDE